MDRQDNNKLLLTEELLLSVSVWNLFYLFFLHEILIMPKQTMVLLTKWIE